MMENSTVIDESTMSADSGERDILSTLLTNTYMYLEVTGYVICLVSNIFGNSLTLIAMRKFSFLKDKAYVTLQSLTVADLLMSFFMMITLLLRLNAFHATVDTTLFVLGGFAGFFFHNAMLHVLLVAIDRFVAVVFPFFYMSKITKPILIAMSFSCMGIVIVNNCWLFIYVSNDILRQFSAISHGQLYICVNGYPTYYLTW